jgi:hypothetical protein
VLGEAKATAARRGTGDLERLAHIRDPPAGRGYDTSAAALVLFSLHGFHPDLIRIAVKRKDLSPADLPALCGAGPVQGADRRRLSADVPYDEYGPPLTVIGNLSRKLQ